MRWREVQPETPPPRRAYHTANAVPAASRFLVFGGTAPSDVGAGGAAHDFFNDVWLYKVEAFAWEACRVIGEPPPPRAAHSAVLLPQPNAKLVVFGGTDSERIFGDTWLLHLMDTRWEKAATHGPRPSRRCYHSATLVRQQMLVFGGRGHGKYAPPCMLAFDLLTCEWRQVPHDAHAPAKGRTSHAAIAIGECLLVYGGKTVREDGAGEWRTDSVLLFDAASMRWLPPPEVRAPAACTELHRSAHTATCGTRGVLVIGGYAGEGRYLESVLSLELVPCQLPGAWVGARDARKRPRRDGGGLGSDDVEATSDALSRPQGLAGSGKAVGEGEGEEERDVGGSLTAGRSGASGVRHEWTEAQLFARLQQAELSLSEALETVRARDAQLSAALQRADTLEQEARRREAALTEAAVCEQRALEAERRAVIRCELAESKGMENSMSVQLAKEEVERGKEAVREAVARAELAERKASELGSSVEKLTSVHQSSESARVQLEEQLRWKSEKLAVVESELKAERDFRAKCEAEATSQRATLATLGTALGQRDLNLERLQSQLHEVDERKKELQQQLESAKAQMAESRSELAELRRASSEQKQDAARLVSECEALKNEVGILKQAKHQVAAQLAALTQQLVQGKEHERRLEGEILVLSDARKSLEPQLKEAHASLQALKADLARREGARAAAQRRLRAFPEMVQAVQALLEAPDDLSS